MRLAWQCMCAVGFVACTGAVRNAESWQVAAGMAVCAVAYAYWFVQELFRREDEE